MIRDGVLALALSLLAACRTGGTPGEVEPVPTANADLDSAPSKLPQSNAEVTTIAAPGAVAVSELAAAVSSVPLPTPISGYDGHGALTCLPLPSDRRCITRQDPLVAACRAAKGEVRRCEDCASLCTRAVK